MRRRDVLTGMAGVVSCFSKAFAEQPIGWDPVYEDQKGDIELPYESVLIDPSKIAKLSEAATRATFRPRSMDFATAIRAHASRMVGISRANNPDAVASILKVFGLPFRYAGGKLVPFCAAGVSYAASQAYSELYGDGPNPSRSALASNLAEIDHYHFYPSPSVWDIYMVGAGKRRWVDRKSASPKPGWIVIFDFGGGADHCGIVDGVDGSTLHTIEFNTKPEATGRFGNRDGGVIARRRRSLASNQVKGFIRTDIRTPL